MHSTIKYLQNKEIVYREEDDGAFLFDPQTGNLKYMNRTGREAFLMLAADQNLPAVVRRMTALYPEVELSQIKNDVEVFLKNLEECRFILPANGR